MEVCNRYRNKYKNFKPSRVKRPKISLSEMKYKDAYYDIVICLIQDTKKSKDHIIGISNGWIFDSRLSFTLPLEKNNLDKVCGSLSSGDQFISFHEQIRIQLK